LGTDPLLRHQLLDYRFDAIAPTVGGEGIRMSTILMKQRSRERAMAK